MIKPNIANEDIRINKVLYEGEISVEILFKKKEKIEMKEIAIPFNFEISSNKINTNVKIITDIIVRNENFIIQNSLLDITMILEFALMIEESRALDFIEEITVNDTTDVNPYSMIIYFVKPGDTLWKIAKKFKSTVEDIARVNEIENENKIYIGKQLYIPKSVKCNG